jgi:hypothetical protein
VHLIVVLRPHRGLSRFCRHDCCFLMIVWVRLLRKK